MLLAHAANGFHQCHRLREVRGRAFLRTRSLSVNDRGSENFYFLLAFFSYF